MPEIQHPETTPEGLRGRTQGPPLRSEATHGPSESSIPSTEKQRPHRHTALHWLTVSTHPSGAVKLAPGVPRPATSGSLLAHKASWLFLGAFCPPGFGDEGTGGLSRW